MNPQTDTSVSDISNRKDSLNEKDIPSTYPVCKICFMHKNPITSLNDLIAPCGCKGSIKYVHQTCLRLWRFKGKHIREIKKCEQCLCEYRYLGDYLPHKFVVKFTTAFAILLFFYLSHCLLNSVIEAVTFLMTDEADNLSYDNLLLQMRSSCDENLFYHTKEKKKKNRLEEMRNVKMALQPTFKTSVVLVVAVYVFTFCWRFWPVLNLFFTIWRVYQFNFWWDRYLLGALVLYYVRRLYVDSYKQIDTMYIFLLNYKG